MLLFLLAMCALGFRSPFTYGGETANPPGSLTTELVHRRHSSLRAVIKATHPLLPWKLNPFRRMLSLAGLIPPGLVYFHHFRVDSGHKKPTCPFTLLSTHFGFVMRCVLWSHRCRAISFSFRRCLVFSLELCMLSARLICGTAGVSALGRHVARRSLQFLTPVDLAWPGAGRVFLDHAAYYTGGFRED